MKNEKLLEVRKYIKSRKPEFIRQDAHKKPRLSRSSWRKPKGLHSKIREQRKGRRRLPEQGYRSPIEVRGMHNSGVFPIVVNSFTDIVNLSKQFPDKNSVGVIVGSVGKKKKVELIEKILSMKLKILNVKNPEKFVEGIKSQFAARVKEKKEKSAEKEKKKKDKEDKKKDTIEEKVSDEEKKDAEKKEMDKVVSQKD